MAQKTVIYLDQNKWVELLREQKRNPSGPLASIVPTLQAAVADGKIMVPLSATHYLETWHRADWESRFKLATLMRSISRYATLAPVQYLQKLEVRRAVFCRLLPRYFTTKPSLIAIGYGVNHAFNSPWGRLRLIESVAEDGKPEGLPIDASEELIKQRDAVPREKWEWWSLAGFEENMRWKDFEVTGQHRLGDKWMKREVATAERLRSNPSMRSRLDDVIVTEEFNDLLDNINDICEMYSLDPHALIQSAQDIRSFVQDVPTRYTTYNLRRMRHRNPQHPWAQHDFSDLLSLSVAIPYSDIVITERQWVHFAHLAKLDRTFNTKITSRLSDLKKYLTEL
ncbi:hypothetical protein [Nonomuraea sp. GTA35]|uniref:hypothetical protein n=1 Tax=Nonomuraea sp. GTA35 TaxID=1676746 RepID=UPI0035BF2ACF